MRKKAITLSAVCIVLAASLAGCLPGTQQSAENATEQEGVEIQSFDSNQEGLPGIYASMAEIAEEYAPEVVEMEDGTLVQRTPDTGSPRFYAGSEQFYNTYYLNADNRGCISCHTTGLSDLVHNKMAFTHWQIDNGLGTNLDVTQCLLCHNESYKYMFGIYKSFGDMIHGIHSRDSFTGNCMSCHTANADGEGMELWEESKYDVLSGIVSVTDVQGDFYYEQETLGGSAELAQWPWGIDDAVYTPIYDGTESDVSVYDTWTITVSGMLDEPYTITLADLIEQAPSETFISKIHCCINPMGGEFLGNMEVTGVPISWIIEKAGIQDGATTVSVYGSDGGTDECSFEDLYEEGGWLIYEINGEPLTYAEGFPCRAWYPSHCAPMSRRWISEIVVDDREAQSYEGLAIDGVNGLDSGWFGDPEDPTREYLNKPNQAICNTYEGEIVTVGEAYSFEGWADAFDETVVALEFSMDGGDTWTKFDTSDSDKSKWVYWHFDFTPEEAGAYVLQVRATTDQGRVSCVDDKIMIVAKTAEDIAALNIK